MNDYYDKYLAQNKGASSYQEWLITTLEQSERNIYGLLTLCRETEIQRDNAEKEKSILLDRLTLTAKCTNEFIDAIRNEKNRLAHYKMLELETFLEEYGYRTK